VQKLNKEVLVYEGYQGIYELRNAGRYLYITAPQKLPHYTTIHRWVRTGLPSAEAQALPERELFINFQDLISLRMIISLRLAGFSLQHVRRVHAYLQELTGNRRPFALRDLWISSTDIFVKMETFLSATRHGQYAFEFIKVWLKRIRRPDIGDLDLTFVETDSGEIASTWTPQPHIVLDPLVQFGAPCLQDTRIPTIAVWSMVRGGDMPENIARGYSVPLFKVQAALEWEEKIAGITS
jgi:uncharacterized protein (DUF433 family)